MLVFKKFLIIVSMDTEKSEQQLPDPNTAREPLNYLLKKIDGFMDKLDCGLSNNTAQQAVIELQNLRTQLSTVHTSNTKWIIR
jgi:hypothetical protein